MLRNIQATIVQRRVVRIQVSPSCFVIIAAIANAKGTAKPTKPRYSIGGWMTMYASCKRGFNPFPSRGTNGIGEVCDARMTVWLNGFTANKCIEVKNNEVVMRTAVTYGIIAL